MLHSLELVHSLILPVFWLAQPAIARGLLWLHPWVVGRWVEDPGYCRPEEALGASHIESFVVEGMRYSKQKGFGKWDRISLGLVCSGATTYCQTRAFQPRGNKRGTYLVVTQRCEPFVYPPLGMPVSTHHVRQEQEE